MQMEQITAILTRSPLFRDVDRKEIPSFLTCLHAETKAFGRNTTIFTAGDTARMGIVLSGEVRIHTEDLEGRQNVIAVLEPPDLFGEVFALSEAPSTVTAFTDGGAEVLFFDVTYLTTVCGNACSFHRQFIWNLLNTVARKNVALNHKIQCISRRTTREKVESFLLSYREKTGSSSFTIPFNRSEMADYLCVERSALSAVLSQMQKDRVISFHRNAFRILT